MATSSAASVPHHAVPPPGYRRDPLRIALVQFNPKLRQVADNIAKVEGMLQQMKPGDVDLIVLPEMCFTGYMFTDFASIEPFLEPPRIGPTALWCRETSKRLKCHIVAGYPELPESSPQSSSTLPVAFNSALVSSPTGEIIHNYRKTFLFETDKGWATAGEGFSLFHLPPPIDLKASVGICMDINPKDFIAPWDAYEFSRFCADEDVDLMLMPMNWLQAPPPDEPMHERLARLAQEEVSEETLNYWANRLTPLIDPTPSFASSINSPPLSSSSPPSSSSLERKTTIFVAANRVGTEQGTTFIGSSTVFKLTSGIEGDTQGDDGVASGGRVEVLDVAGRREEIVLFVTVD